MRGLWPSLVMNDKTKRTMRGVGNNQGSNFPNGQSGNAPHFRSRRKQMAVAKSEKAKPSSAHPQTIGQLIRAIRSLGLCRITQIGNNEWQIDSREEGRVSCLLVSGQSKPRRKPGCNEGGNSRLGRGKEKGKRGRDRTRPVRGANQSHNANKRSARNIYEVFRPHSISTRCLASQFSDQSQS